MAKKTAGFVELEWQCPNCGTANPGSVKTCANCGSPQPQNVHFRQKTQAAFLEGDAKQAAQKGADTHCPYCDARNPADAQVCSQCGGDLREGARRAQGQVVGAFEKTQANNRPVPCPNCNTQNPPGSQNCSACGASLVVSPDSQQPAAPRSSPERVSQHESSFRPWMALPILAFLCILCSTLGYIFLRTDTTIGLVDTVEWKRTVEVLSLQDVQKAGWEDDVPADARNVSCTQRLYVTQSAPAPGAREVCGTPYSVDLGNGYAEVVQDCSYEVYDNYCEYTVKDWAVSNQLSVTGSDLQPYWPDVSLGSNEREGQRNASYVVYFLTDGGMVAYETNDEQLFLQFTPGSQWTLEIGAFGNVVSVQP